jgi:hypothetical protein
MQRLGVSIEPIRGGRFGYKSSGPMDLGQQQQYDQAETDCNVQYPFPGPSQYTSAEWAALYKAMRRQAECFKRQGIPVGDPPSQSTWIDSRGAAWNPASYVPDRFTDDDQYALLTKCPSPG